MKATKFALKWWNKNSFRKVDPQINLLLKLIDQIQQLDPSPQNKEIELNLQFQLQEYLKRRDMIWRQDSIELWLKEGIEAQVFSNCQHLLRRKNNIINAIKDDNNNQLYNQAEISNNFLTNFRELFYTSQPTTDEINELIEPIVANNNYRTLIQ